MDKTFGKGVVVSDFAKIVHEGGKRGLVLVIVILRSRLKIIFLKLR